MLGGCNPQRSMGLCKAVPRPPTLRREAIPSARQCLWRAHGNNMLTAKQEVQRIVERFVDE